MKGTRRGKGPPSADLLVCFPSRAHLTLMPKPICSPARPSDSTKRHHNHDLKKISTRIGGVQAQSSPLLWSKSKNSEIISEPTSPKVTCAGQIKVKPKQGKSCKNWQSVMEEIEKLHNRKSQKKKGANWMEAIGIKKDVMQFLTCLRNIRFEFRCFGSFPTTAHDITSDEDEDEELNREANHTHRDINNNDEDEDEDEEASRTVFSKWFMVLQDENPKTELTKERGNDNDDDDNVPNCVPPPNALLLMRCRSAPPKSWLQETQQQVEEESEEEEKEVESTMEEMENKKKNENLVVMRYGSDFHRFSSDIAKETWVVGGVRDQLSKSRSWKK
ncbi:hypothetical protein BC332_11459 [Capsicum chinense]|uniref:Uncharacterized protein n=1 Tax=Capsicum annuum TaxID=4072 RepID=A0A1U8GMI3_CAPAN|nr:putative Mitochondrial transcription termination factor family protein [Capsicum annuum]PHT84195.1 hypothetical protein T459_12638 [Capsicum annuum]PHU20308.1 hypothetical protein BC332_11459 [Capsicum chinense]